MIERIGVDATNEIQELQEQIAELHEYLQVNRLAQTRGFILQPRRKMDEIFGVTI